MHKTIKLAPSILSADFTRLGDEIRAVEAAGAHMIHIDVMDGQFVPNITMGPLVVEAVRRVTDLPLDVHLMIIQPAQHIEAFAAAGASAISVHIEADHNLHRTLARIRDLGCKAGVALNPHTPSNALSVILHSVDLVNVMTVNPGFGGQAFLPGMMSKVAEIRAMIGDIRGGIDLEVDGGIDERTALSATQAGANVLIAGSAVFGHDSGAGAGLKSLQHVLDKAD
jgi:ribulose-phosphate 3-epimerase